MSFNVIHSPSYVLSMQISLVVMIAQYALWAVFRTPDVMFAVAGMLNGLCHTVGGDGAASRGSHFSLVCLALGLVGGMSAPINRAMLSKAVPAHEQVGYKTKR
jgi:hypothetical protein